MDILNTDLQFWPIFIGVIVSLLCGIILAVTYAYKNKTSKNMILALILIPMVVNILIVVINGNLGTSVAVLGTFSLVRFRSAQGNSKDITFIFLAMVNGICAGLGYYYMAPVVTVISCLVTVIIKFIPLSTSVEKKEKHLKITIPDDINFDTEFKEVFLKYTDKYEVLSMKTTQLGSLYVVDYSIVLKEVNTEKQLIDELRIRNSNLPITCNSTKYITENSERAL